MATNTMALQPTQWFDRLVAMLNRSIDNDMARLQRIARKEIAEIDMLFTKLNVNAWIDRRHVTASATGGFIRYPVLTGGKVASLANVDRDLCVLFTQLRNTKISTAGVAFPQQWIEVPYPLPRKPLLWSKANLDALGKFQALIGIDHSANRAQPVLLDYSDDTVSHVLLSGTTGSGKSTELAAFILSLAYSTSPADAKFLIVDPKISRHILPLARLPHVSLSHNIEDCLSAIATVKAEKDRRKGNVPRQRVFLFVEEFAEIGMESDKGDLITPLRSVVGTGRELGVHVVACTQKPTVDVIDTVLKANLPTRIAGRVLTAKESEVATGLTDAHAERLPGRGSFIFFNDGSTQRVQGYYLTPSDIGRAVDMIAVRWRDARRYEVAAVEHEQPTNEIDSHVEKVLAEHDLSVLARDGKELYGAKAKIAKTLFGQRYGGHNVATVDAVLDALKNASSASA